MSTNVKITLQFLAGCGLGFCLLSLLGTWHLPVSVKQIGWRPVLIFGIITLVLWGLYTLVKRQACEAGYREGYQVGLAKGRLEKVQEGVFGSSCGSCRYARKAPTTRAVQTAKG